MGHDQCLTEETVADYLEGGLDPAVRVASEVHLITCNDCRHKLGFFMRLLGEDITPEEQAELALISAEWSSKTSRQSPRRTGTFKDLLLPLVAIAALLIVGIVSISFVLQRMAGPKSASDVVSLLLQRQRPFESRLSDQPYLPLVRTRGTDDPGVSYGLLAAEMTRLSASSYQMGRFYLLQKDFDRAIPYLEMAERENGAGANVQNDLGVAYLESGGESRIQKALEQFRDALDSDSRFAPAAFNLAMLYEHTGELAQAQEQWRRYLQIESDSAWADEARSRLQGLNR